MNRSIRLRLNDIIRAIDGAEETIAGIRFETFQEVYHMPRTVERCIEIVSEATRHIPDKTYRELCLIAEDQARSPIKLSSFSSRVLRDSVMPKANPPMRAKPRIISIATSKGGMRKMTTAVNLAGA